MDDVKLAVASNIIKLRTAAGMTQAELGEKLNYSDKSISKWERAESLPDAFVLKQIGDIFNVSVDYLLSAHDNWEQKRDSIIGLRHRYSGPVITMLSVAGVWTLAVLLFVILWLLGSVKWCIFVYAIPVSLVTLLVQNSIWLKGRNNRFIVAALVPGLIASVFIALLRYNPWQLFLVLIPAEFVVFLSFRIKKSKV